MNRKGVKGLYCIVIGILGLIEWRVANALRPSIEKGEELMTIKT